MSLSGRFLLLLTLALFAGSCSRSKGVPTAKDIEAAKEQAEHRISSAPSIVPLTIKFRTSLSDNYGHVVLTGEKTIAFRSDGSKAISIHRYAGGQRLVNADRHVELATGNVVEISDTARTFSSLQPPEGQRSLLIERLDPRSHCEIELGGLREANGGSQKDQFLGYEAFAFQTENKDHKSTFWRAPTLNCVPLHVITQYLTPRGEVEATEEEIATNIDKGDPNQELFGIPPGYVPASFSTTAKKESTTNRNPAFDQEDALYDKYKH